MDLNFSPEDLQFRDRVRAWFTAHRPQHDLKTLDERRAWHRQMYEAGYIGMGWPKEYGGQDARPTEQAIVADEMARVNAPSPINGLGIGFIGPTIIVHGTAWQKERYLKKILTAEEIWCQLYSEPGAGSDLAGLRTKAEAAGDHYIVNGQKVWTSSGFIADWGILLARTNPASPKHQGISCFLINMRQPGITVRPLKQITGGSEFSEVFITDARVDNQDLIGQLNQGWHIAQTTLGYERGAGTLNRFTYYMKSLRRLAEVAKTLRRNGQTAWDDPIVRQKIGQALVELEVMRYSGLRILSRLEKGQKPGSESAIAKLYYSEFDKRYHELMMSIMGPYGDLIDGAPPELSRAGDSEGDGDYDATSWAKEFLTSRAPTIFAGTSEIQKNIIGERVLGLPKDLRADRLKGSSQ